MIALASLLVAAMPAGMVIVPAGTVEPFFRDTAPSSSASSSESAAAAPPSEPVPVAAFALDVEPVTVGEFDAFLRAHPEWRRSRIKRIFADDGYLKTWSGDLAPGARNPPRAPVTEVSWFAANAYCRAHGKRLPTVAQWERAASESGDDAKKTAERILDWYGAPTPAALPAVGGEANRFGVRDLHGLVWEWTLDFNDTMTSDDGRSGASRFFCGSAGAQAVDPSDYATFMRWAFRNSLKAAFTVRNLGFRCAQEIR